MRSSSSPLPEQPASAPDPTVVRRLLEASRRAEIVAAVNAATSAAELGHVVTAQLCQAFEAELALVVAGRPAVGGPELVGSTGVGAEQAEELLGGGFLYHALTARAPRLHLGDPLGLGAQTVMVAPFADVSGDRGAVVVACLYHRGFDAADLALLEAVARSVGHALERLWLIEDLRRRLAALPHPESIV
jgi:GAF domain-containing protein